MSSVFPKSGREIRAVGFPVLAGLVLKALVRSKPAFPDCPLPPCNIALRKQLQIVPILALHFLPISCVLWVTGAPLGGTTGLQTSGREYSWDSSVRF